MKKRLVILAATAALVAMAAVGFAAGPKAGRAAQAPAITPDQRATVQKILDQHQDKLYDLREKIWAKHAELQALSSTGKAEKADIQALVGDISKLRAEMHKERLAIRDEIEKQTGLKGFGAGGYHHRFGYGEEGGCPGGGYGKGFGRGMGAGMGAGACPGGGCN